MPDQNGLPLTTESPRIFYLDRIDPEVWRLRSVIEDAAHFSELGHDVSRFLREEGLRLIYGNAATEEQTPHD